MIHPIPKKKNFRNSVSHYIHIYVALHTHLCRSAIVCIHLYVALALNRKGASLTHKREREVKEQKDKIRRKSLCAWIWANARKKTGLEIRASAWKIMAEGGEGGEGWQSHFQPKLTAYIMISLSSWHDTDMRDENL